LEDKHKVVEMIFVPISFTLARRSVKCKLNPFYIQALEYIENANVGGFSGVCDYTAMKSKT
jgi:hypothetical protein